MGAAVLEVFESRIQHAIRNQVKLVHKSLATIQQWKKRELTFRGTNFLYSRFWSCLICLFLKWINTVELILFMFICLLITILGILLDASVQLIEWLNYFLSAGRKLEYS